MALALSIPRLIWNHPANRGRRVQTLLRALSWQVWKRVTGKGWLCTLPTGLSIYCYPTNDTSGGLLIYCNGRSDFDEFDFLERLVKPGDGFLDVGAHVGHYTLFVAGIVGLDAAFDVFEPFPQTFSRLRENIDANKLTNARLHNAAVADEAGELRFSAVGNAGGGLVADGGEANSIAVQAVTLDEVLEGRTYAAAKIDIEGAEPRALRGARGRLEATDPPVWIAEYNPPKLLAQGSSVDGLLECFRKYDFVATEYDAQRRILNCSPVPEPGTHNRMMIARRRLDEIASRVGARLEGQAR